MVKATVFLKDAFLGIGELEDNSVDALITDPPYFLDGMGDTWEKSMVNVDKSKSQVVTSLRKGMKFDKQQGVDFENFMKKLASEAFDKIKPGGWIISFSSPRLYHRLAVGVEDAGYEIRDMWEWIYTQNQMKAMSVARGLNSENLSEAERKVLENELLKWKTPQVKSCFEPIVLAQKPREGTFYENWRKYHIGLVNVKSEMGKDKLSTSNIISTDLISDLLDKTFLVGKPTKKEKRNSSHLSVKPLALMKHLIEVTVPENGLVLDPFNGSGTTGIAAIISGRNFVGFENNKKYFEESLNRSKIEFETESTTNQFVSYSKRVNSLF